jgi:hypothetical protein
MTNKQIAGVLFKLHQAKTTNIISALNEELDYFCLNKSEKVTFEKILADKYSNGIKHLNTNQLENIIAKIVSSKFDEEIIKSRLKFYEIDKQFFDEIYDFLKNFIATTVQIDVSNIDTDFKGLQVASRDDFNEIINQGWTGDWVITPNSILHKNVQVASMNETGKFPRGFYLNAEIDHISPISYGDQIRYRIFIKNPVLIDSGNRNVKFNLNPVKYIN